MACGKIRKRETERKRKKETDGRLGAVLLSASEPSVTRQLNALTNVVRRALLFGGEAEIAVLSETLAADRPAFVARWYAAGAGPGSDYLDALVSLLRTCRRDGAVDCTARPPALDPGYGRAYARLTAGLLRDGSGYVRAPRPDAASVRADLPRTPTEELGRLARWESSLRGQSAPPDKEGAAYPDDLVGRWSVSDDAAGGASVAVSFGPGGAVTVPAPARGLRWRLDPGPTHLDTCTFQVMGEDGAVLQYTGFLDRGARLESRFSGRDLKIAGCVTFQMRDVVGGPGGGEAGGEGYKRDMLPVAFRTGKTRFVMTKAGVGFA